MSDRVLTRRRFTLLAATSAVGATVGRARVARADAPVNALLLVLHAKQSDGGAFLDPQVADLPQLRKPPFSAYDWIKLIEKKVLPLEKGKPVAHPLVNGRTLQVTLNDVTADKRYVVAAAINQPGGQAFLKLLEVKAAANEPFFVAGQAYQGGTLVLGIKITP